MAVDKLVDSTQLDACCTAEANAIRAKTGSSAQIAYDWANSKGFADAIAAISGGGGGLTLIDTYTTTLSEYTNTSTSETIDTGISAADSGYAFFVAVITCDTAVTTSTEWGASIVAFGVKTGGGVKCGATTMQQGSSTLYRSAMVTDQRYTTSYGVWIADNTSTVKFCRKAYNSTIMSKCRAGTYTVKVFALTSL